MKDKINFKFEGTPEEILEQISCPVRIAQKLYSSKGLSEIRKLVDQEYEIYKLRHGDNRIGLPNSLLQVGHHINYSNFMKNCIGRYVSEHLDPKVKFELTLNSLMDEEYAEDTLMAPRRGAVPEVGRRSKPYEICCHVTNTAKEIDASVLDTDNKLIRGMRTTEYLGDPAYMEKEIMCLIVKVIGKNILYNIEYFSEYDNVDPDSIRCELNNFSTMVDIEHKRFRFSVASAVQVRITSKVLQVGS